jgi:hypothetical protein
VGDNLIMLDKRTDYNSHSGGIQGDPGMEGFGTTDSQLTVGDTPDLDY